MEQTAYVYVMQDGDRVKIGIALDPMKRKRQITTATGLDIVLRSYRQFSTRANALSVERALHKRFARYRLAGEWFEMRADRAVAAMQEIADPQLHAKGWKPGMPPEAMSSTLEQWRWKNAQRKGEPYTPLSAT